MALEVFEEAILELKKDVDMMKAGIRTVMTQITYLDDRIKKLEYVQRIRKCNPFDGKDENVLEKKEDNQEGP